MIGRPRWLSQARVRRNQDRRRRSISSLFVCLALWGGAAERLLAQTLTPSNIYMSAYHAPVVNSAGVAETRANAFTIVTNGVINHASVDVDRVDSWNDDNAGITLDFVGLQYATPSRFDFIQIELGRQF